MKKILGLLLAVVLAMGIMTGCSDSNVEYTRGTIEDNVYTSEWMGLSYTVSDDMTIATEEELFASMELGADMLGTDDELLDYAKLTVVYELTASNLVTGNNIVIMSEKIPAEIKNEAQYVEILKENLITMGLDVTYDDVTTRTLGDVEFTELAYTMDLEGVEFKQTFIMKKLGDRMAVMTLTYFEEAELDTLLAGFAAL